MTQEDYIKTHPEQFKDDTDKWLFLEFGIIGGCCSAEKSHEYHIARMVAEKLNNAFIEKACEWIANNAHKYIHKFTYKGVKMYGVHTSMAENLRKYMEE